MKVVLRAAGLPVLPGIIVTRREWEHDPAGVPGRGSRTSASRFAKPARGGSSIGHHQGPRRRASSTARSSEAPAHDPKVLVEASSEGAREIECGVLDTLDGAARDVARRPRSASAATTSSTTSRRSTSPRSTPSSTSPPTSRAEIEQELRATGGARLRGAVVRGPGAGRLLPDARRLAGHQRAQHDARLHPDRRCSRGCGPPPGSTTPAWSTGWSSSPWRATPACAERALRGRRRTSAEVLLVQRPARARPSAAVDAVGAR